MLCHFLPQMLSELYIFLVTARSVNSNNFCTLNMCIKSDHILEKFYCKCYIDNCLRAENNYKEVKGEFL
ncbi:hypothetical protein DW049_14695 [Ruminococcus sp. AF41-9]|nr:hypothetical protein DW049_14695 [Ruminococcus sp. AF41-9]